MPVKMNWLCVFRYRKSQLILLALPICLCYVLYTFQYRNSLLSPDSITTHRMQSLYLRLLSDEQGEDIRSEDSLSPTVDHVDDLDVDDLVYYNKDISVIWVGGVPRSGTTLMRVLLDAHPDVRCGEETRIVPRIVGIHTAIVNSTREMTRLAEAHITDAILSEALGAYLVSMVGKHGNLAPRLCNKDPFTARGMTTISKALPNSIFLLMIRDGRATCHSLITRHVGIGGFDTKSQEGCLRDWNRSLQAMLAQCESVGKERCLHVRYEQLVLHPRAELEKILDFVKLPWDDRVLRHVESINQTDGVSLSGMEPSTSQVVQPIYSVSLSVWAESFPDSLKPRVASIAPVLAELGYDPTAFPPDYGRPDDFVQQNDKKVRTLLNDAGLVGNLRKRPDFKFRHSVNKTSTASRAELQSVTHL